MWLRSAQRMCRRASGTRGRTDPWSRLQDPVSRERNLSGPEVHKIWGPADPRLPRRFRLWFCQSRWDFCHSIVRFDLDKLGLCQFKLGRRPTTLPIQPACYRTATAGSRCFSALYRLSRK